MAALPGRTRDHRITGEQAALRRVATLVARGAPPEEVFAAVAAEAGRLLDTDLTDLERFIGGTHNSARKLARSLASRADGNGHQPVDVPDRVPQLSAGSHEPA
jgi:GAF domain-containing protein